MTPDGRLQKLLDETVADGLYDSLVAVVATADRCLVQAASGEGAPEQLFDLASLTKPVMATVVLRASALGTLAPSDPIGRYFGSARGALAARSLSDLLRHRSGLLAWVPLYELCQERQPAIERIASGAWLGARVPTYSDLGYVLLGAVLEQIYGMGLPRIVDQLVASPLGLASLGFQPGRKDVVARCRIDTAKEVELARGLSEPLRISKSPAPARGQVQDGNARFLGPSGHAGLFGSVSDLVRLGQVWLRAHAGDDAELSAGEVRAALEGPGRFLAGFEKRRLKNSGGPALSPASFGHTGFTGGSLWVDPDCQRVFVLLGHRSSPSSSLQAFRRRFHRVAADL